MSSRALSKNFLIVVIVLVNYFRYPDISRFRDLDRLLPFEEHFAALTGDHDVEALLEVLELEVEE